MRSTQASSRRVAAGEQRQEGGAGERLDQSAAVDVGADLAARRRPRRGARSARATGCRRTARAARRAGSGRRPSHRPGRAGPPARPGWSSTADRAAHHLAHVAGERSGVGQRPSRRRSGTPPRARGAPCSASAGRSPACWCRPAGRSRRPSRSAYPVSPSSSTVAAQHRAVDARIAGSAKVCRHYETQSNISRHDRRHDGPVHLDDLAEPALHPRDRADPRHHGHDGRGLSARLGGAARQQARTETGLDDFGPDDYRERLDVYLAALRDIDGLHGPGIVNFYAQLLQCAQEPAAADRPADPPPRDPRDRAAAAGRHRRPAAHRHHPSAQPAGGGARRSARCPTGRASSRSRCRPRWVSSRTRARARMDVAVELHEHAMPHFALMHEMTTDHVHEEIQLLANDFSTMFFETLADVPRWRDYYLAHDQTSHYEYLRTQLKALQFLRGGRRWLLKSPQHLEQLPVLEQVFPGVTVVCHPPRPGAGGALDGRDAHLLGAHAPLSGAGRADRRLLDRPARTDARRARPRPRRHPRRSDRSTSASTTSWPTTSASPSGSTASPASRSPTRRARRWPTTWPATSVAGSARVVTSCEMFGLDEGDLRARFAPYVSRFLS